jgi:ribosomal RNA-processing protein 9
MAKDRDSLFKGPKHRVQKRGRSFDDVFEALSDEGETDRESSDVDGKLHAIRSEKIANEDSSQAHGDRMESAAEKRLRLARTYLESLDHQAELAKFGFDAEEIEGDYIAERLKKDAVCSVESTFR